MAAVPGRASIAERCRRRRRRLCVGGQRRRRLSAPTVCPGDFRPLFPFRWGPPADGRRLVGTYSGVRREIRVAGLGHWRRGQRIQTARPRRATQPRQIAPAASPGFRRARNASGRPEPPPPPASKSPAPRRDSPVGAALRWGPWTRIIRARLGAAGRADRGGSHWRRGRAREPGPGAGCGGPVRGVGGERGGGLHVRGGEVIRPVSPPEPCPRAAAPYLPAWPRACLPACPALPRVRSARVSLA